MDNEGIIDVFQDLLDRLEKNKPKEQLTLYFYSKEQLEYYKDAFKNCEMKTLDEFGDK